MFGQSLLSAFGSAACTTDTDQLFATDVQTTSLATYQLNASPVTSIPSNTYPGTASNITYAAGKFGNAAVFNGTTSNIEGSFLSMGNSARTYSVWFKATSSSAGSLLTIGQHGVAGRTMGIYLDESAGYMYVSGFTASHDVGPIYGFGSLTSGSWYNIVLTWNAISTFQIYLNGSLLSTQTKSATYNTNGNFAIGKWFGDTNTVYYYNSAIDQVRIFNSALPQAAVTALYNETTTTATYDYVKYESVNPNSIAYYKMSDATDQFGNYNGTATNVNFNTEGKFGFAGEFNGSSSYMQIPNNSFNYSTMTFSAWVNPSANGTYDYIFQNGMYDNRIGGSIGWYVRRESGGALLARGFSANSLSVPEFQVTSASGLIPLNTWTNVVVVLTPTSFNIYLNGSSTAVASATFSNAITYSAGQPAAVYIGANYYYYNANLIESFWEGKIDQIRIYDAALSAANVTTLYNEIECPAVAVTNAFNTVLYTGNSGTQSITGTNFTPDLVWAKSRTSANWHYITDSVRGVNKVIYSNEANAQDNDPNGLSSFNSNGFTVGASGGWNGANNYVAWNWKAGGTAVSNTDGTITSQVSANVEAGFSIVKYTGSSPNQTVGHGLDATPEFIVVKNIDTAGNGWATQSPFSGGADYHMMLNLTQEAKNNVDWIWNDVNPTSTVFSIGQYGITNQSGDNYIAYCWHSVPGYSKVGSYTGTGATGNVQYVGFEPSFVMVKATSTSEPWFILDNKRDPNNPRDNRLMPDSSAAESNGSVHTMNFNSNNFTLNGTVGNGTNGNGQTYIFLAIA